jgi:hypothetical protein
MATRPSKAAFLKDMKARFPDRWEVDRMEARFEGQAAVGAIKIHCLEDDKIFLSDFSAKLDDKGKISELTLDGVHVGKFIGRMHSS